jgi:hypothetical protein
MTTVDVLIITDGRDCVVDTIESAAHSLVSDNRVRWWAYCDSPLPAHQVRLYDTLNRVLHESEPKRVFWHPGGRQGFGGAIRYAWEAVAAESDATHLFHLEDDFTFNRPVPLDDMAQVLDNFPEIVQMALRRQPWNDAEIAAGGVVELRPDEFHDSAGYVHRPDGGVTLHWLEHQLFWTTNPSLIRMDHIRRFPWPDVERSEGVYTHRILDRDPNLRFAYWGARDSGEWVHHIGDTRTGTGY